MSERDAPDLDIIDDPYRKCFDCEQNQHEEWGHGCEQCDEWICTPCWDEHESRCQPVGVVEP